ncbi:MAG: YraN family protein [Thermodesulfobacteriota bacterium]
MKTRPSTRAKGNRAEQLAAEHLESRGYRIIERNFFCRVGEIDLIAMHGEELVFVEVRARYSANTVDPVYSVNRTKQRKIIKAALVYLANRPGTPPPMRFDVAVVDMRSPRTVEVIPHAFDAESSDGYL